MSEAGSAAPAAGSAAPAAASAESAEANLEAAEAEIAEDAESTEEGNEDTSAVEAKAKKAVAEAEKSLKKKYNLKVNNKAKEFELDLGNDAEVQKYLQKAMAADEKFAEAATLRKQVEQLVQELKTNPLAVLRHEALGIDIKKLAEQVLNEEIQDMNKSPEQKKIEELEKKLTAKEEREKAMEEEKRQAEIAKMNEQAFQELDDQISSALAKSELPKSPYVIKRIADAMIEAVQIPGYENVTVEQIMPFVEQQITGEIQKLFEEAPDQVREKLMEKLVGKKNLDGYRKSRISKAKSKVAPVVTAKDIKDTGAKSEQKKEPAKKTTFKEMFGKF